MEAEFVLQHRADIIAGVHEALEPEVRQSLRPFVTARLTRKGGTLRLYLAARNTVRLRAATNSFLRLVVAAIRTLEVVEPSD